MSIIVNGMEIPKSCADCFAISEGLDWCKATGSEVFNPFPKDDLPSFCPLSPLPEKHGRLIDADDFSAVMKERQLASAKWLREAKDAETINRAGAVFAVLCEVKRTIGKLLTIVEAEGE